MSVTNRQTVLLAVLASCAAVSLALPFPAEEDELGPLAADEQAVVELEDDADDLDAAESSWRRRLSKMYVCNHQ